MYIEQKHRKKIGNLNDNSVNNRHYNFQYVFLLLTAWSINHLINNVTTILQKLGSVKKKKNTKI